MTSVPDLVGRKAASNEGAQIFSIYNNPAYILKFRCFSEFHTKGSLEPIVTVHRPPECACALRGTHSPRAVALTGRPRRLPRPLRHGPAGPALLSCTTAYLTNAKAGPQERRMFSGCIMRG